MSISAFITLYLNVHKFSHIHSWRNLQYNLLSHQQSTTASVILTLNLRLMTMFGFKSVMQVRLTLQLLYFLPVVLPARALGERSFLKTLFIHEMLLVAAFWQSNMGNRRSWTGGWCRSYMIHEEPGGHLPLVFPTFFLLLSRVTISFMDARFTHPVHSRRVMGK